VSPDSEFIDSTYALENQKVQVSDRYDSWTEEKRERVPEKRANVISSLTHDGRHMPVLDIDKSARYGPSSTPGHGQIYFDVSMSWWRYRMLLRQFYKAGIIQKDFYDLAALRKQTFVRRPGITKRNEAAFHEASLR
jgi:hypothetical protein